MHHSNTYYICLDKHIMINKLLLLTLAVLLTLQAPLSDKMAKVPV
jgi:hypothetical protein